MYQEEAEVETDEEVEEVVQKEVVKDVVQEMRVPQVRALHPFSGQGLKMTRGEVSAEDDCWFGGAVILPLFSHDIGKIVTTHQQTEFR